MNRIRTSATLAALLLTLGAGVGTAHGEETASPAPSVTSQPTTSADPSATPTATSAAPSTTAAPTTSATPSASASSAPASSASAAPSTTASPSASGTPSASTTSPSATAKASTRAAAEASGPCTGFTATSASDVGAWATSIRVAVSGTMPGTSCTIDLPQTGTGTDGLAWAKGTWPFASGAGEMRSNGSQLEFVIYPEYAATHDGPFTVDGFLAAGVTRSMEQIVAGTDVTIKLPGVTTPVLVTYPVCPECGGMPTESSKWAFASVNDGEVTAEVRLGSETIAQHPTVTTWTITDTFTSPQTCQSASLRIMRPATGARVETLREIDCGENGVTATLLPGELEDGATYGLLVRSTTTDRTNPATDSGTIDGDGKELHEFTAKAEWTDGGADGRGGLRTPSPTPTPTPTVTPTATPSPTGTPAPEPTDTPTSGPTTSGAPTPGPTTPGTPPRDRLPQLGTEASAWTIGGGLALLVAGGAFLAARRRI